MIILLIPAYNEQAALGRVLASIPTHVQGHELRTIVLNDGSSDDTSDVALKSGVEVLNFEENRGKGAVLKAGFELISSDSFDAVVLMDSDGQHDPACLGELVHPVLDGSFDVVVGSRYMDGGARGTTPRNRYFVRVSARAVLRVLLGADVTDPFSGYRVLSRHAVECVQLIGDRYESELEILFCAQRNGLRISELSIPKIYGSGTSKMGTRYGAVLGRIDVVARYALTIGREARSRASMAAKPSEREKV